jgi:phosphoglucosamine mutase
MSNVGLEIALRAEGIELLRTDVGDRHVYLAMVARGHPVGGEQSGHIIFLEDARTGDGILAALRLLDVVQGEGLDLEVAASVMKKYPQLLKNVRVSEKRPLESLPRVAAAARAAEAQLAGDGRVVLRYSGTEPLARVMIEGPDLATVESLTDSICAAIRDSIPGSR